MRRRCVRGISTTWSIVGKPGRDEVLAQAADRDSGVSSTSVRKVQGADPGERVHDHRLW